MAVNSKKYNLTEPNLTTTGSVLADVTKWRRPVKGEGCNQSREGLGVGVGVGVGGLGVGVGCGQVRFGYVIFCLNLQPYLVEKVFR